MLSYLTPCCGFTPPWCAVEDYSSGRCGERGTQAGFVWDEAIRLDRPIQYPQHPASAKTNSPAKYCRKTRFRGLVCVFTSRGALPHLSHPRQSPKTIASNFGPSNQVLHSTIWIDSQFRLHGKQRADVAAVRSAMWINGGGCAPKDWTAKASPITPARELFSLDRRLPGGAAAVQPDAAHRGSAATETAFFRACAAYTRTAGRVPCYWTAFQTESDDTTLSFARNAPQLYRPLFGRPSSSKLPVSLAVWRPQARKKRFRLSDPAVRCNLVNSRCAAGSLRSRENSSRAGGRRCPCGPSFGSHSRPLIHTCTSHGSHVCNLAPMKPNCDRSILVEVQPLGLLGPKFEAMGLAIAGMRKVLQGSTW